MSLFQVNDGKFEVVGGRFIVGFSAVETPTTTTTTVEPLCDPAYTCIGWEGAVQDSITDNPHIIPNNWKTGNLFIDEIQIGNTCTFIGSYSFSYVYQAGGSLNIPDSVTSIGSFAFAYTGFTGSITIGNGVTSIGNYAFEYMQYMQGSLVIGNAVQSIGNLAFAFSTFAGTITIPNSVTSIGNNAFDGCTNLTTVNCYVDKTIIDTPVQLFIASGVTTIHARASDGTWQTSGPPDNLGPQTIGGKSGITVIKDL